MIEDVPASGRIAIVGAGPAGLYSLQILAASEAAIGGIDVIDALPAPFGLVRYGVAPDHPRTRAVQRGLGSAFDLPGVRFFGNVRLGEDVTIEEFRGCYDAVLLATGMNLDRELGIPGESLPGSYGAAEFVSWYNARPDAYDRLAPFVSCRTAVVVGGGNVALDVARMLSLDTATLAATDMPKAVFDALRTSGVRDVHVLVRRGPTEAKFTAPELRELEARDDVSIIVDPRDLTLGHERVEQLGRSTRNMLDLFTSWAQRPTAGRPKRLHFHFHAQPDRVLGGDRVTGISFTKSANEPVERRIEAGMVVRAIGYRGAQIPGVPFDPTTGTIPNERGRVHDYAGAPVPGLFVVGWAKRGPSGVIGTNRADAGETVGVMLDGPEAAMLRADDEGLSLDRMLRSRGVDVVDWADWKRIEAHERDLGNGRGCDSVKVEHLKDYLVLSAGRSIAVE